MTRPEIPPPSSNRLVLVRDGGQVIVMPLCVIDELEKRVDAPPPNEGGIVGWAVVAAVLVAVVWGVVAYLR